jgi:predicted acetyltransferase
VSDTDISIIEAAAERGSADLITIEVADERDWDDIYSVVALAFHHGGDPDVSAVERLPFEPLRTLVARRDGAAVGTVGLLTRALSVPGAILPAAHVTNAAVAPTARRQGVLTRFMHRQFADARAAGEPIAVLWATEGRIYQRFGYGLAARVARMEAETREVRIRPVGAEAGRTGGGRLREGSPDTFRDALVTIYDRVCPQRPGWSGRADRHWDHRLADPPAWRRGSTPLRAVIHEGHHGPDGYALWRVQGNWTSTGPGAIVQVLELVALDPSAYAVLWNFMFTMDLARSVQAWHLSVDEPLQYLVNEPRRLGLSSADGLWLRIVDVPAALAGRRYAAPIDLVLEVSDAAVPQNQGRWRLRGDQNDAACTATSDEADLHLDVRELGATYLGGVALSVLGSGGLVHEARPGTLAAASTAFGWPTTPSTPEVF